MYLSVLLSTNNHQSPSRPTQGKNTLSRRLGCIKKLLHRDYHVVPSVHCYTASTESVFSRSEIRRNTIRSREDEMALSVCCSTVLNESGLHTVTEWQWDGLNSDDKRRRWRRDRVT